MNEEVNQGKEGCHARKHKRFKRPTKCVADVVRHFNYALMSEADEDDDTTVTVESYETKHVPDHEAKKSDENVDEENEVFQNMQLIQKLRDDQKCMKKFVEDMSGASRQSYLANIIPLDGSFEHGDTSFAVSHQVMDHSITNFILEYHCLLECIEVAESALGKARLSQARMESIENMSIELRQKLKAKKLTWEKNKASLTSKNSRNSQQCYGYQMQMYHSYPDGYTIDKSLKMSHCSMANELQRFPVLKKRIDDVIGNFLRDGLQPSETMIGHIVEMEMDYINTSRPNFIGGSKAVEMAIHQVKSSNISTTIQKQKRLKDITGCLNVKTVIKGVRGYQATLAGNVMGPISLTRLQLPRMLKRCKGHFFMIIIYFASSAPGQKSMDDIVKMGIPQNKGYTTPNLSKQCISLNDFPEYNASLDNDWSSINPPLHINVVLSIDMYRGYQEHRRWKYGNRNVVFVAMQQPMPITSLTSALANALPEQQRTMSGENLYLQLTKIGYGPKFSLPPSSYKALTYDDI
ncbi:dynamin-related protein 3A [Tanacetum coccineum]